MTKLYERQMREKLFHGDETRWEVFEDIEGKTGHRWYLWVMQSASVVLYRMAPGRGADVPKAHFAKLHKDLVDVVLVCDRYSAYKCLAKDCDDLILAFCWAHVRRDFLKAARSSPELKSWMFVWMKISASSTVSMSLVWRCGMRRCRLLSNRRALLSATRTWQPS